MHFHSDELLTIDRFVLLYKAPDLLLVNPAAPAAFYERYQMHSQLQAQQYLIVEHKFFPMPSKEKR